MRIIDYNYNGLFPVRDKFRYIEKLEMTFDFKMTVDSYLRNILQGMIYTNRKVLRIIVLQY